MNNISNNKEIKVTQNQTGQAGLRDTGHWLKRIGMDVLVCAMQSLSAEYGLAWADHWTVHLDDPKWLARAMVNTFMRLGDADKAIVNPLYEDWLWYSSHFDLEALVGIGYVAEVYLLDRNGQRISADGEYKTVVVKLDGASRKKALCQLKRDFYEFVRWWY